MRRVKGSHKKIRRVDSSPLRRKNTPGFKSATKRPVYKPVVDKIKFEEKIVYEESPSFRALTDNENNSDSDLLPTANILQQNLSQHPSSSSISLTSSQDITLNSLKREFINVTANSSIPNLDEEEDLDMIEEVSRTIPVPI